jgi:hypothetical protein
MVCMVLRVLMVFMKFSSSMPKECSSRTRPSRRRRQSKEYPSLKKRRLPIPQKLQLKSTLRSLTSKSVYNEWSNASFVKSTVTLKLIVVKRNLRPRTISVIRVRTRTRTRTISAKDKDIKTSMSVFFSKSSAPAAADPDSEDESYEPRVYVVNAIQLIFLTSSEGGSHAMPDIVSDDDSLPGLIFRRRLASWLDIQTTTRFLA